MYNFIPNGHHVIILIVTMYNFIPNSPHVKLRYIIEYSPLNVVVKCLVRERICQIFVLKPAGVFNCAIDCLLNSSKTFIQTQTTHKYLQKYNKDTIT